MDLTKLEALYLNRNTVCVPSIVDGGYSACDAACIVNMLPRRVTTLGVRMVDKDLRMKQDLTVLGAQVREGMFPALNKVEATVTSADRHHRRQNSLGAVENLRRRLRRAFVGTSVQVSARVRELYGRAEFRYGRDSFSMWDRHDEIPAGWLGWTEWRVFDDDA